MYQERIEKLWLKYIDEKMESSLSNDYFSHPHCETCKYYQLFREDVIYPISVYHPDLYKHICDGMEGKIRRTYKEEGVPVESYYDHIFYGFCKRYPPVIREEDSVLKIGLFSIKNNKIHNILDGYRFPVLHNKEWCGEWKLSGWVKKREEDITKKEDLSNK